jgi:ADP-heptose:LPS heptosyltransferase
MDRLADFWRNVSEVDEVLQIEDGSSVFAVARKIRGRFDVAILFPSFLRPGIEIWLAGIPRRVGFSKPWRDLFVNQFVRQRSGSLPAGKMGLSESLNAWRGLEVTSLFGSGTP